MCPQCFEINPAGSTFCRLCGASLASDKEPGAEGSDSEVYRELAQTNLFRMRGAYKDAIQSCLSILKKYPNNATAHTLLGDIHAEMGELQQAAEWYEMALDLSPKSEADKEKLASMKARIIEREKAQTAEQIGLSSHRGPNWALYTGVTAALIILVGGGSYALGAMATGSKPKPPLNRPVNVPPSAGAPSGQGDRQGSKGGDSSDLSSLPVSPDRTALDFLKAQGRSSGRAVSLTEDPRTQTVFVTAELDAGLSAQGQAALIAADIFTVMPSASIATVKIVQGSQTVFVGDVQKAAYEEVKSKLTEGQTVADQAQALLTNTWPPAGA